MPDVMNNQKVAETIKRLLKEHQMTQEDLANKLSISKSAVSQNLSGKSNFDIQNLIAISKLFDISMDELLYLKQIQTDDIITEYKKVVKKGLSSIQQVPVEQLKIADADLYGKVLVDYIIDDQAHDMFKYLDQNQAVFVHDSYHRAKEIYLKIIKYMLENHLAGVFRYILKYTNVQGSFILDEINEKLIWNLINQKDNQQVVTDMISHVKNNSFFKNLFKEKVNIPLSKSDLLEVIGKYNLDEVLQTCLENYLNPEDFMDVTTYFHKYQYTVGITLFIDKHFTKELNRLNRFIYRVQESFVLSTKLNDFELVKKFLTLKLYTDLTEVTITAYEHDHRNYVNYMIENYSNEIRFYVLADLAVRRKDVGFIHEIAKYLKQEELNKLLSIVSKDDLEMIKMLFILGARFTELQFEFTQFEKINKFIEMLIKGDN